MKALTIARNIILAATLASGFSCKMPLVERPKIAKTNHPNMTKPHPCTRKVMVGGLNSSCHILFQDHPFPLTKKITKEEVRSQILLYHVLSDLIKNYEVRVVLFEGIKISEDARKTMHAKCSEECLDTVRTFFERCTEKTDRLPCGRHRISCWTSPRWLDKRSAEDFCLAKTLWSGYKKFHATLLILHNPSVFFTGFERNLKKLSQDVERHRLLLRLKEYIELLGGQKMGAEFEALVLSAYMENVVKQRNEYVEKDAVNEIILRSPQDSALVIGVGHKESMEAIIRTIPFHERPTFYFIMPECQDEPAFSVSSEIIDITATIAAEKKTKQNL